MKLLHIFAVFEVELVFYLHMQVNVIYRLVKLARIEFKVLADDPVHLLQVMQTLIKNVHR